MTNTMNNEKDKPAFICRDGMTADNEYVAWLHELKERYHRGQIRTSIKVNSEVLAYYWSLGRDIVMKQAESKWGNGFFNQLNLDMKKMFPNENGFSVTNLKYMKRWYIFYTEKGLKIVSKLLTIFVTKLVTNWKQPTHNM